MKPTPDSLRLTALAKEANAAKKPWQSRQIGTEIWYDAEEFETIDSLDEYEYRPTPSLKYREWTHDEVLLGAKVTNGTWRTIIAGAGVDEVQFGATHYYYADEPAYPARYEPFFGLTKRELFAAMALQGLLANADHKYANLGLGPIIEMATEAADALLSKLENKET